MSFPVYDDYNLTSTVSLGSVPSHWSVIRLGMLETSGSDFVSGPFGSSLGSDDYIECGVPVIRGLNTTLRAEARFVAEGFVYVSDEKFSELSRCDAQPGDLVFTARGTVGKVGIVPIDIERALISPNQLRLRPSHEELHADYLYYVFSSASLFSEISLLSDGVAQPNLNLGNLKSLRVPLPPPDEQKAISSFLDVETSKIDGLVSEQRRLIELLKEKRQAVISHAVTKGLNPNAPMKPSGIQWLGDVPQHWEIMSLRRVVKKFVDYRGKTPARSEAGIPLVTASAVRDGEVDHSRSPKYVTQETYDQWMVRGFPEVGDVVFTTEGATFGETGQIVDASVALAQRLILFKTDADKITNGFLYYHFLSDFGQAEQWSNTTGTTVFGVRASKLKATTVIVPPLSEQEDIERHIKEETSMFGEAEAEAERAIELLQERRTALISAAVTGKIDVREFAYQETA